MNGLAFEQILHAIEQATAPEDRYILAEIDGQLEHFDQHFPDKLTGFEENPSDVRSGQGP